MVPLPPWVGGRRVSHCQNSGSLNRKGTTTYCFTLYENNYVDVASRYLVAIKAANKYIDSLGALIYWQDGKTYLSVLRNGGLTTEECIYIHYQKRKMRLLTEVTPETRSITLTVDGLRATEDGLVDSDSDALGSIETIDEQNLRKEKLLVLMRQVREHIILPRNQKRVWL